MRALVVEVAGAIQLLVPGEPAAAPEFDAIVVLDEPPVPVGAELPALAPPPAQGSAEVPDLRVWREWPVWPSLILEADARKFSDEFPGSEGFALGRARLGLRGRPLPWLGFVMTVDFIGERPGLLDADLLVRPVEGVVINVGYAKTPLFASFNLEPVYAMPLPDRSPVVVAFRNRRDLGVGILVARREVPLELRLRVGNGSSELAVDQGPQIAGYGALDLVLGRARRGHAGELLGLRLGVAGLVEHAAERPGIQAIHPLRYAYTSPVPIAGLRSVAQAHLIGYAGPARLLIEGAIARETQAPDPEGDPAADGPRPGSWSGGLSAELAIVALGLAREVGLPPAAQPGPWRGGALELSARSDWLTVNRGVASQEPGGSLGGALGIRWWPIDLLSLTLAGYGLRYTTEPLGQPDQQQSWGVILRLGMVWGVPVGRDRPAPAKKARPPSRPADTRTSIRR